MSFDADEEILQDFLVEAGEILELLSEQLVELENRPNDSDLLNAIFRGFHTVKGGAGFLQLEALHVGPEAGEAPAAADGHADGDEITDDEFEALLDQLHGTGKGPGSQPTAVPSVPATPVAGDEDLITDDEFESLLDELHGPGRGPGAATTPTPVSAPAPAAPEAAKPQPPAPPAAEEKPAPKPAPDAAKPAPTMALRPKPQCGWIPPGWTRS